MSAKAMKKKSKGRPKVDDAVRREVFTVRLPNYLIEFIKKQKQSNGRVIERSVIYFYDLD